MWLYIINFLGLFLQRHVRILKFLTAEKNRFKKKQMFLRPDLSSNFYSTYPNICDRIKENKYLQVLIHVIIIIIMKFIYFNSAVSRTLLPIDIGQDQLNSLGNIQPSCSSRTALQATQTQMPFLPASYPWGEVIKAKTQSLTPTVGSNMDLLAATEPLHHCASCSVATKWIWLQLKLYKMKWYWMNVVQQWNEMAWNEMYMYIQVHNERRSAMPFASVSILVK
jgi:hypothetical protein